jgi:thiamine-monophosphate kinase
MLVRKSLAVNVSDIAAMGAIPRFYLVSIALPKKTAFKDVSEFYRGMKEVAGKHGLVLIGGDTVRSPHELFVSIMVVGEVKKGHAILRSGAMGGDAIYASGTFGGSALGLHCLKKNLRGRAVKCFIKKHVEPEPNVRLGRWLCGLGLVNAMIDVSDSLLADLSHIADESGVGFVVDADRVPVEKGFEKLACACGLDPLNLALTGGEDYGLVFTVGRKNVGRFEKKLRTRPKNSSVKRIGTILANKNLRIVCSGREKNLRLANIGFDHFK